MGKYEYLALDDNSDELQHWKYIKRYKNSKGKWVYVYADKYSHTGISDLEAKKRKLGKQFKDNYEEYKYNASVMNLKGANEGSKRRAKYYNDILSENMAETRRTINMKDKMLSEYSVSNKAKKTKKKIESWISKTGTSIKDAASRTSKKAKRIISNILN